MRCLTDIQLQAVADGEAADTERAHAAECASCRERLEAARRAMSAVTAAVNREPMPPRLDARVRQALAADQPVRGATALRPASGAPRWRWAMAAAAAAVILVMVYGVLPRLGSQTTLSASQILGRSLETMANARGIEELRYELIVDGMSDGPHQFVHFIDHDQPTRYRIQAYNAAGELLSDYSQDPVTGRRSQLFRVDGRNYIVAVEGMRAPVLSMPQMAQALVETSITMMQATSDPQLTVIQGPTGPQYAIETPPVAPADSNATLDLHRARAVVDGGDYRIHEFQASGTLLRQPFSVSFRLLQQNIYGRDSMPSSLFLIEPGAGDVVLAGQPSDGPLREWLETTLRALADARGL